MKVFGERIIAQEEKEIRELEELAGGKNCKEHKSNSKRPFRSVEIKLVRNCRC
jgi:F420-0:gamma-glutamyl ligase